ncbi:hypothetical protein [Chryseobacterium sp.]|uniref:hypothetical protein n=1 Tax=Chryseobacterium sp. TaxID=1871047 RepID=UPI0026205A27|nr:hypothetical protein [Chryseobacterium sp.]
MKAQELDTFLTKRVHVFDLKKKAFETLHEILSENPEEALGGFTPSEVTLLFDGYQYLIDMRYSDPIIRARIGLYVENELFLDHLQPIGYYDLEADLDGEIVDDSLIIEQEKYLKDIGIIAHFQSMNEKMPLEYLRKDHIQYEFVTYISMIGTLFVSKNFEGAGLFIYNAKTYLETTKNSLPDKDYLKESKRFLKMTGTYLINNNLVSEELKQKL